MAPDLPSRQDSAMSDLLNPLSDAELAELDRFLLARVEDEEELDEGDPGVTSIFELDGLFAAVVSGPVLVKPEQWMQAVWGDHEPEWESEAEFDQVIGLMMRHMNTMAATLAEAADEFEPLFEQDEEGGETFVVVDDWCEGYVKGVALCNAQWRAGGAAIEKLLNPIRAFSSATHWRGHELGEAEIDQLSDAIAPSARSIHAIWQQRDKPAAKNPSAASAAPSPWDKARKH
jgi:uncharacterized protein